MYLNANAIPQISYLFYSHFPCSILILSHCSLQKSGEATSTSCWVFCCWKSLLKNRAQFLTVPSQKSFARSPWSWCIISCGFQLYCGELSSLKELFSLCYQKEGWRAIRTFPCESFTKKGTCFRLYFRALLLKILEKQTFHPRSLAHSHQSEHVLFGMPQCSPLPSSKSTCLALGVWFYQLKKQWAAGFLRSKI